MTFRDFMKEFIGQDRVVVIHVPFLKWLDGDVHAAFLLGQLIFWSGVTKDEEGWFHHTYQEWEDEIHLKKSVAMRCIRKFEEMEILETKVKKLPNGSTSMFLKLDFEALQNAFGKWHQSLPEVRQTHFHRKYVKHTSGSTSNTLPIKDIDDINIDDNIDDKKLSSESYGTPRGSHFRQNGRAGIEGFIKEEDDPSPKTKGHTDFHNQCGIKLKKILTASEEQVCHDRNLAELSVGFRLLQKKDGKTESEIVEMLDWLEKICDESWCPIIRTSKEFRQKFPSLRKTKKIEESKRREDGEEDEISEEEQRRINEDVKIATGYYEKEIDDEI